MEPIVRAIGMPVSGRQFRRLLVPGCMATSTGGAAAKKRLAEYCASGESLPSDRSCAMLALRRAGDAQSPELAEAVTAC